MAIIKKKSLVVALVSSFVIAMVMIFTLAGYYIFLEFRGEEFRKNYQEMLCKTKAKVYSKYIEIGKLDARIENSGMLKGKPIIEGVVTNNGAKDIFDLALKISFLDKDNTVIYETTLRPQEPVLGSQAMSHVSMPYLPNPPKTVLKPKEPCKFKKIISSCPTEIFIELREGDKPKKNFGKWSGKLTAEPESLDF